MKILIKLTELQLRTKLKGIQDHLKLVFVKVTPNTPSPEDKEKAYKELIEKFDKTIREKPYKDSTGWPKAPFPNYPDWYRMYPPVWVDSPMYPLKTPFPEITC